MEISDLEKRLRKLEILWEQHNRELNKLLKPEGDYYSVRQYAETIKLEYLTQLEIESLENKASELSKKKGYSVELCDDPRYGSTLLFSENILENFFAAF